MNWMAEHVWLIPLLPLMAAGILALTRRPHRRLAATLAIGTLGLAFVLSCLAFLATLAPGHVRTIVNTPWFTAGQLTVHVGWILDPLSAAMLVMITLVGSLIFIFSTGYMADDPNFTRFFAFLSLFAAAMLGLVVSNSLLVLFVCWELVGLASYLLIGFWFTKPAAAAAAKKAFITTRIGDLGLFAGMLWLNAETGTLLFYDEGRGCLESGALGTLVAQTVGSGMTFAAAISLLAFWGAVGKSGQFPLHVWLPDAMEGPTPVSALIHAATMVAAGVFLMARMFPLLAAAPGEDGAIASNTTLTLTTIAWLGAGTAAFAGVCAIAQTDLKRILAYSTVSQLGLMFVGVATGGPAVGMLHLLTHALFKALLFLGAGSVIHACHHEQDIRRLGGLRRWMPITFATYGIGMMALSGVPAFFAGFWSKDAVLHGALGWPVSKGPFVLCVAVAVLTAFYMTRQMCFVFFGHPRSGGDVPQTSESAVPQVFNLRYSTTGQPASAAHTLPSPPLEPHESPRVMTVPLVILAVCTVLLSMLCTPFWPWLEHYLAGPEAAHHGASTGVWGLLLLSSVASLSGLGLGWWAYRSVRTSGTTADPVTTRFPLLWTVVSRSFGPDAWYPGIVARVGRFIGSATDWLDRWLWAGFVDLARTLGQLAGWASRRIDEDGLNDTFDAGCTTTRSSGSRLSRFHNGQAPRYLRIVAMGAVVLALMLIGWKK